MILTDREIQAAIVSNQIVIHPAPDADAYSATSVDLTLSPIIRVWHDFATLGVEPPVFTPGIPGYKANPVVTKYTDVVTIPEDGYVVEPGSFLLAWTMERLELPPQFQIAARVEGKSSLARHGIGVHVTAPTIHPGFTGQLTLEMYNIGSLHVKLHTGMRVCQLIFEQTLGTPDKGYAGQFADQRAQ